MIEVYNGQEQVGSLQMNDTDLKQTIERKDKVVGDATKGADIDILQYSTCVIIESPKNQNQVSEDKNTYIFSLILVTNFDHILNKKQEAEIDPNRHSNLDQIDELANRILELN